MSQGTFVKWALCATPLPASGLYGIRYKCRCPGSRICCVRAVVASEKGVVVGRLTFREDGDLIDCQRMGVGGKAIPPNVDKVKQLVSLLTARACWLVGSSEGSRLCCWKPAASPLVPVLAVAHACLSAWQSM